MNLEGTEDDIDSADNASKASKRIRKQTTKGKEFQLQLLEEQRSSAQRNWRKQLNKAENCLADSKDPSKLQSERMFLETKMDNLIAAQGRLDEAQENFEAKRVAQKKFETWEIEHSDALKRLNRRITELKEEKESLLSSTTSKSSRSGRVSRTAKSRLSRASHSSAIDRKTDMAAKVAKLKTELSFADGEATKVAELRKLKLTKELAIAEAEMNAIKKVQESELDYSVGEKALLPDVISKSDLLQNYLITQASSVTKDSLPTMETDLNDVSEPSLPKFLHQNGQSHQDKPKSPGIASAIDTSVPVQQHLLPLMKSRAIPSNGKEIRDHLNVAVCARTLTTWMSVTSSLSCP